MDDERKTGGERMECPLSSDQFRWQRRMFCVNRDGEVRLAEAGLNDSHMTWMIRERVLSGWNDDHAFARLVRGYHWQGNLVAYRGHRFEPVSWEDVREALPELVRQLDLSPDTRLWSGARMNAEDVPLGREYQGTVGEWLGGIHD